MKKIRNKLKYIIILVIGIIVGSTVGIVATNVINANQVGYSNSKTTVTNIQDAIDELYLKANNIGGKTETLTLETSVVGSVITISYTGTYSNKYCVYGTSKNYGNVGSMSNNTCTMIGTPETTYYYKIVAVDDNGKVYIGDGELTLPVPTGVKAIVYYNPVTNTSCTNYTIANSQTGTKTGCMKWYAYKEDSTTYTMILDHNTTDISQYNRSCCSTTGIGTGSASEIGRSNNELGYDLAELTNTSGWKVTPRLITGQEIADITGNTSWRTSTYSIYLDTNCNSLCTIGKNRYAWLFDYTGGGSSNPCTSYGCNVAGTSGYWTDTTYTGNSYGNTNIFYVSYMGNLSSTVANNSNGLRPVITVSKSVL